MIYLDHNATSPLHPRARAAWLETSERFVGNPSSPHRLGARADHALAEARERVARILHCHPEDLLWTSGATESANAALHDLHDRLPPNSPAWVSSVEHPCVLATAERLFGSRLTRIPVDPEGKVQLDWIHARIQSVRPGFIAVMAANNETGALQPWTELRSLCAQHGIPYLCDAVQWLGRLPAAGLGECDYLLGAAHKLGGPRGVGFLKIPRGQPFRAWVAGGPQEDQRRAGTENVPGAVSFAEILAERENQIHGGAQTEHARRRDDFESALKSALPESRVLGAGTPRLWNTSALLMPELRGYPRWVVKMDKAGFAVSTGSACSSGREKPSHVLEAMGFADTDSGRVLRLSSGWETPSDAWHGALQALLSIARQLRRDPPDTPARPVRR